MYRISDASFPLFSRSITRPATMEISAVPEEPAGGVKVPVHVSVPETRVRAPTVPTDFVMYELNMLANSSLAVIVRVVVWPANNVPDPDRVIEMLGTGVVESIVIEPGKRNDKLPDRSIPYP